MNQRALEAGARAAFDALPLTTGDFDDMQEAGKSNMRDVARAVITAYEAHLKADGFVVVPVIPSPAMAHLPELPYSPAEMREFWTAMLSAATTGENDASE